MLSHIHLVKIALKCVFIIINIIALIDKETKKNVSFCLHLFSSCCQTRWTQTKIVLVARDEELALISLVGSWRN